MIRALRMRSLAIGIACLLAALAVGSQPAAATSPSPDPLGDAKARAALLEQVRSQLGSNLADALQAQDQLAKSLKDNADQQALTQAKIEDANAQIAKLDAQIARLDVQITATERRIVLERLQLRSLARAIYVQPGSVLVMMAEAKDLSELITRVSDLRSAGNRADALKLRLTRDQLDLQSQRTEQSQAREEQAKLRDGLKADLAKLKDLQAQQEASQQKLADKINQTRSELALVSSQSAELAQKITDLLQQQQDLIIATAMQQVWDQVKIWQEQNNVSGIATSSGHSKQYRFIWAEPQSQMVQGYGPSTLWFEPAYGGFPHFHTGLDMVEPQGSPIFAADDGVVALVGSGQTGYGNYVVVAHAGGLTTLYGHLSKALVKVGETVTQGQPVGLEGSTGNSTGPHLHFELRIAAKPVDPAPYLPPGGPSAFKG